MKSEVDNLISDCLSLEARKSICKMIEIGVEIFKKLKDDNENLFLSDLASNVERKILDYCITRQFAPDMIDNKLNFESYVKSVNNFNYKITELVSNKLILHLARTNKLLPNKAKYKLELACNNDFYSNQQIMEEFDNKNIKIADTPYYGFITYYIDGLYNISSINIVVPNYNMKEVLYSKNIYQDVNKFNLIDDKEKEMVEKRIVKIKQELKENIV